MEQSFFYLRKAFDIVDHTFLISKLDAHKVDQISLNLVKSYLTDRKQCFVDGNVRSSTQCNRSGVPKGSVFGPVLFLLFVNDIPLFVKEAYLDLYADDATMHTSTKKSTVVENKFQVDSNRGAYRIKCFSHIRKTPVMIVGSRQSLLHTDN